VEVARDAIRSRFLASVPRGSVIAGHLPAQSATLHATRAADPTPIHRRTPLRLC
jgi:hypothetical protein